jgi:putative tricarboxylic transport membrane protein
MVALYAATHLGGGHPGDPGQDPRHRRPAATTLDGYPMAKQGRGQRALVLTFVASTRRAGHLDRDAVRAALSGPRRLLRHSAEMVVIMLFGLTLIAAIAAGDTLKGLIAGLFGLLLAAMGSDWIYATPEALPLSGQPGATTSMSMPGD